MRLWLNRIRRGFKRSPGELFLRMVQELKASSDRFGKSPIHKLNNIEFINLFGFRSINKFWENLSKRSFITGDFSLNQKNLDLIIPGEFNRIIGLADQALSLEVDLLGSGPTALSKPIQWTTDFKVDLDWPVIFFRDIDILDIDRSSDVKIPWELSRLQWLIPVGQAYKLTGDGKYSDFCCQILKDWIEANPYGRGVNWAIAMEPAMRIFVWTWLFHIFKDSTEWSDQSFRFLFLRSLYEHGIFVERYIEDYGDNGNHCTADAGGLVFVGLFFGAGANPLEWQTRGWDLLLKEISNQILDDGVNFEGSIAYHRFVSELFFWPAKFRYELRKEIPEFYTNRLLFMADFIESYTKPNGLVPLWGDADDGRVLPFGGEEMNDHSYLPDLIRIQWGNGKSCLSSAKAKAEILWTYGMNDYNFRRESIPVSRSFACSGFYIMANDLDHIFIDCGPIGFNGKGGHGHNDCLSFEAVLDGAPLVSDSGCYVYSASQEQRDKFRGTAAHNTPIIDNQEQNRFISKMELFSLQNDATPEVLFWQTKDDEDIFIGSHSGFQKLSEPVSPVRKIILEKNSHRLIVKDEFKGRGEHKIKIPLHLSIGCEVKQIGPTVWSILSDGKRFNLIVGGSTDWAVDIVTGLISPSYGVMLDGHVFEFSNEGPLETLVIGMYPVKFSPEKPENWLQSYL